MLPDTYASLPEEKAMLLVPSFVENTQKITSRGDDKTPQKMMTGSFYGAITVTAVGIHPNGTDLRIYLYSVWPKNRNICKIIAIEAHSGAKFEEKMRYKSV